MDATALAIISIVFSGLLCPLVLGLFWYLIGRIDRNSTNIDKVGNQSAKNESKIDALKDLLTRFLDKRI